MRKLFSLLFVITALTLSSCKKSFELVQKNFFSFSTFLNITSYLDKEVSFKEFEKVISTYDKLFDPFKSYKDINNIYSLNNTNEELVLDKKLFDALKVANEYFLKSNKYFNPYIGELSFEYKKAFEQYNKTNILNLPSETFIKEALKNIDEFSLLFNEDKLSVKRIGKAKIDLGGFAKGYVIDALKETFKANEINYYFINAGSSSSYFTVKPSNEPYICNIRNIKNVKLKIANSSLGVSSVFEQLINFNNKTYTHIINPKTGLSETYFDLALVKEDSATLTDVFSTALMVIKDEEVIEKLSQDFNFDYLLYKDNNIVKKSSGIELIK